jgi:glyoxylase-like metal-dependent hydrolase (beta-lactamase superfamily II)
VQTQFKVGDITIHRIVEQEGPLFPCLQFFPSLTKEIYEENRAWLQPKYIDQDDKVVLCIQSYLVQTPHHTILVDSCVGNHKPRPTRPFWHMMNSDRYEKNLASAGFGVGDIDFVMCTHLHGDHVGWNTRLDNGRWVPTFPKARYVFAGDMIHSPLQARYPEIGIMVDYDSKQAGATRRELFGKLCDTSTLVCTAHFPSPSAGRIVRWKDAFDVTGV